MAEGSERHSSGRLLLRQRPGVDNAQAMADQFGWPMTNELSPDADNPGLYEVVWAAGDGISLHYVDDGDANECFVQFTGINKDSVTAAEVYARQRMNPWKTAELIEVLHGAARSEDRARYLTRLGLAVGPESANEVSDLIIRASQDPDRDVRSAAVWSMAYTEWPEFAATLRRVISADPDDEVRADAESVLAALEGEA